MIRSLALAVLCLLLLTTAAEARCYDAHVNSVYDGDTFRADVDLGFSLTLANQRVRILEIDAPEIRPLATRTEAERVRDILIERIGDRTVVICTEAREFDSFGRILAYVFLDGVDIGRWLLEEGLVEPYQ